MRTVGSLTLEMTFGRYDEAAGPISSGRLRLFEELGDLFGHANASSLIRRGLLELRGPAPHDAQAQASHSALELHRDCREREAGQATALNGDRLDAGPAR